MIDEIGKIIQKDFGIDSSAFRNDIKLGERGVGLDSQEIIDLTCSLEKVFKTKLPTLCFTKLSSLEDVVNQIQKSINNPQNDSTFDGSTESFIVINCSAKMAYKAIYEMEKWPQKLPHVKRIETLYNDAVYQEFLMDVASDTGLIQVRSIRRCTEDKILFFQPTPPKFLKHHCGGWLFIDKGASCEVKTWHKWNLLHPNAEVTFPQAAHQTTSEQVAKMLSSHAELALKTWKEVLEASS